MRGAAHAVVALERMELVEHEGGIGRVGEQFDARVDPAVVAGGEAGVEPLAGGFRLRGAVDALVVEQELSVGVERGGEGSGAGDTRVVVAIVPGSDGAVDAGVGHLHAVLLLDAPRVVFGEFDGLGGLEGVIARAGALPFAVGEAEDVVGGSGWC